MNKWMNIICFRITMKTHLSITTCLINTEIRKKYIKTFLKSLCKMARICFCLSRKSVIMLKTSFPLVALLVCASIIEYMVLCFYSVIHYSFNRYYWGSLCGRHHSRHRGGYRNIPLSLSSLSFMLVGKTDNKRE